MKPPPTVIAPHDAADPRAVLEAIPDALALVDTNGGVQFLNAAWRRLDHAHGFRPPLDVGDSFPHDYAAALLAHIPGRPSLPDALSAVLAGRSDPAGIAVGALPGSDLHAITVSPYPVGEQPRGAIVVQHLRYHLDAPAAALEALARQKDVLLQEMHHRIRNNLQVIMSLLDLQALGVGDDLTRRLLVENQRRVRAIALIHEQLFSSAAGLVDFAPYVDELVAALAGALPVAPDVRLEVDVAQLRLNADTAVACGLAINELVTNAVRHAFPGGGPGVIRVACHVNPVGQVMLTVRDTGIGMSADDQPAPRGSFGLMLVAALARQLRGEWSIERGGGTVARLIFTP
jgi:two-component sensor histidine kinase